MNSFRIPKNLSMAFLGWSAAATISMFSPAFAGGKDKTAATHGVESQNTMQTDDAIRADMKKLEKRIETTSADFKRDSEARADKISAESRAKYNRDVAEYKLEYAKLESRLSSGAKSLGNKISNGTKTALNNVGNALKDLGNRIGSDSNNSSAK